MVGGEEVTLGELRAEAEARGASSAEVTPELLHDVVERKLWAEEAKREKLDQQVEFVLARRRSEDILLADLLRRTIAASVTPPTDRDVDQFLATHPAAFTHRTSFRIEQIDFRPDNIPDIVDLVGKAKSLDEAERLLTRHGISSQRSRTEWNSLFMPPDLAAQLRALPPGKPFVQQNGRAVLAGIVLSRTDVPIDDRQRRIFARDGLKLQRTKELIDRHLQLIKSASTVTYQTGLTGRNSPR